MVGFPEMTDSEMIVSRTLRTKAGDITMISAPSQRPKQEGDGDIPF